MYLRYITIVAIAALLPQARAQTCTQLESKVKLATERLPFVAAQEELIDEIRATGDRGITQCPSSPVLWYAAVRGAEISGLESETPTPNQPLLAIIRQAVSHVPDSARLWTIASRAALSVDFARKAVALDSSYRPAQLALADALAKHGAATEALDLCRPPNPTKSDYIEEAGIQISRGDDIRAERAARKAVASTHLDTSEITPRGLLDRQAYEVLALSLQKLGRRKEAIGAFRTAAGLGSTLAQQNLQGKP